MAISYVFTAYTDPICYSSTGATQSLSSTSMSECCGTHNGLSYQSPSGVCTPCRAGKILLMLAIFNTKLLT